MQAIHHQWMLTFLVLVLLACSSGSQHTARNDFVELPGDDACVQQGDTIDNDMLVPEDDVLEEGAGVVDGRETEVPKCALPPPSSEPDKDAPVALFAMSSDEPSIPFPSNFFTKRVPTSPTGLALEIKEVNTVLLDKALEFIKTMIDIRPLLNESEGFATFAPVIFGFSERIDTTFAVEDPLSSGTQDYAFLMEIGPQGSDVCGEKVPVFIRVLEDESVSGIKSIVVLEPFLPLKPNARYAGIITRHLKGASGKNVVQHPDFRTLIESTTDSDHAREIREVEKCLQRLHPPLCLSDLAVATVFTTRDGPKTLLGKIRDYLYSEDAPPINFSLETTQSGDIAIYDALNIPNIPQGQDLSESSFAVFGTFDCPDFRGSDSNVHVDLTSAKPTPSGNLRARFILLFPKNMSMQPFRLVVLTHGHGGNKERVAYIAKRFGEQGLAIAGIDLIGHGDLKGTGSFMTFDDVPQVLGSLIQSNILLLRFFQVIEQFFSEIDLFPDGNGDGIKDLDLSNGFGYVGESLGSITGGAVCALDENCTAIVLNVGGGGLVNFAPEFVGPLLGSAGQVTYQGLRAGLAVVVEVFDPIAFAGLLRHKAVLMQAVVGDELLDGPPTWDMARATNLTYVCPCPKDAPFLPSAEAPFTGNALYYFDDARHGFFLADATNPSATDAARIQAAWFLKTALENGVGEVLNGYDFVKK